MSRIEAWLQSQRSILELDGTHADRIELEGADGNVWGKWPLALKDLDATIEAAIMTIGEELPAGRHMCKLWAVDAQGSHVSMLPRTIQGRSSAATSAISEARALQQATQAAIRNNEEQNLGLRNENERLRTRLEEEMTVKFELLDKLTQVANASHEMAMREKDLEYKQAFWSMVFEKAGPGLEVLGGALAEKGLELVALIEQTITEKNAKTAEARARAAAANAQLESKSAPDKAAKAEGTN